MRTETTLSTERAAKRGWFGRLLGRYRRDSKGATAIEFAFVALPFFALLFAIIETALVFFAGNGNGSFAGPVVNWACVG